MLSSRGSVGSWDLILPHLAIPRAGVR